MGKKSVDKRWEERFRAYALNLECVKRNAKYRKDYERWSQMADSEKKYVVALTLCRNWGLLPSPTNLPDPYDLGTVERLLEKAQKNLGYIEFSVDFEGVPKTNLLEVAVQMDVLMNYRLSSLFEARKKFEGTGIFVAFPEKGSHPITWGVVDMRRPKREIQEIMNGWIEKSVNDRRKAHLKQNRSPTKTRFIDGLQKLKVYDLVQQNIRLRDIPQEKWFPKGGDEEKKASLYYSQAKKMIDKPPFLKIYEEFQERLGEEKKNRKLAIPEEIPKSIYPWAEVQLFGPASVPIQIKDEKGIIRTEEYWFGM